MSMQACAELVRQGDPDRFLATMTADPVLRGPLFVLYAFNLEIAKAPWVTQEPMIAEMRLQWWRDVVEEIGGGKPARAHEVAGPLAEVIAAHNLDIAVIDEMIAARRWDIYRETFACEDALHDYIDQTSGHLMWLAAQTCGAPDALEDDVRDVAWGFGVANFLRALPAISDGGRKTPMGDPIKSDTNLARIARARLRSARKADFGAAVAAVRVAWQAEALLEQAIETPERVDNGTLGLSEFRRRGSLLFKSLTGGW
ncbi:phytoene/squalene synthase family protein [Yoonia sp. 208BN28-4]|uniref:phytoene/squalene synthase family protein n=1 Tax=Yoonia sp. 208BN28-4 TaxID=3126505 RepID=UPI0030B1D2D0